MIKSSCTRSKCLPEVPRRCTIDNENYLAQRLKLVDLLSMKTFLLSCMLVPKFKKMWKKRGEPDHWTMGQLSNQSISSISGMRAPLKNGSRELRHFSCHGRPIIRTSSPRIRCQFRRRFSFLRQRGSFIWKKNQKPASREQYEETWRQLLHRKTGQMFNCSLLRLVIIIIYHSLLSAGKI